MPLAPIKTVLTLLVAGMVLGLAFLQPTNEETLQAILDRQDVVKMRQHAWGIWSSLSTRTSQGGPAWHTWHTKCEVFKREESTECAKANRDGASAPVTLRAFEVPVQQRLKSERSEMGSDVQDIRSVSLVLFNPAAKDHIRGRNEPGLKLYLGETLDKLKDSIPSFPSEAVVLKTVWWPIRADGSTRLPVWDFDILWPPNSTIWSDVTCGDSEIVRRHRPSYFIRYWTRRVRVVPDGHPVPPDGVALSRFHKIDLLEPEDIENARYLLGDSLFSGLREDALGGGTLQKGDSLALVGMHVVTKDLPNWIWTTFWWHDKPDEGPYASGRPASIKGVWRNYLMDTTWSAKNPRESDGSYNISYNPYLEGSGYGGLVSNCIRCHQYARWDPGSPPPMIRIGRRSQCPDVLPSHQNLLKLDYMFTLENCVRDPSKCFP